MHWSSFWDVLWYTIVMFALIAYLVVLFQIITDLFRDHLMSGWAKAGWVIFLVILPYLTAFVYLITRGKGMAQRAMTAHRQADDAARAYIQDAAGTAGPAESIATAKKLLDDGVINQEEFDQLKARALQS